MKRQKIEIKNSNGEILHANLELPANKKAIQYAIFAHCFTCSSSLGIVKHISMELTNFGFGVLRFDFTGLGSSGGDFEDTNFTHNLSDLNKVNQYLADNYEAPSLLIGHSLGGQAALIAASELDNIKAIVTIGAPSDPKHVSHLISNGLEEIKSKGKAKVSIGGRPFMIKKQFIEDLEKYNAETVLQNLRKPLLIMHSPQDTIVGIDNAAKIYQNAHHPKSFISLDGADHLLNNKKDSLYVAKTIGTWAERYIIDELPLQEKPLSTEGEQVVAHWKSDSGFTTQISNNRHTIVADEPVKVGGDDLGFSPYELLNAALGACTNMTLKLYAERKGWPLEEVYTYLTHSKQHYNDSSGKSENLGKIDHIQKIIEVKGNLSEDQIKRLIQIAAKCPVHKTLSSSIEIETKY
tara:strand:- start:14443 stop:15663 length:1221 start_codon:yes stop_codon:yes gene_type:complete